MEEKIEGTYCDICGEIKDVSYDVNPYNEDVYGEVVYLWMCEDCYIDLCNDI